MLTGHEDGPGVDNKSRNVLLDPENVGVAFGILWNFVAILYISWDISTYGLAFAILDLWFPVTSIGSVGNRSYSCAHSLSYLLQVFVVEQYALAGYCMQYRVGNKNLNTVENWYSCWDLSFTYLLPVYGRRLDFQFGYSHQLYTIAVQYWTTYHSAKTAYKNRTLSEYRGPLFGTITSQKNAPATEG